MLLKLLFQAPMKKLIKNSEVVGFFVWIEELCKGQSQDFYEIKPQIWIFYLLGQGRQYRVKCCSWALALHSTAWEKRGSREKTVPETILQTNISANSPVRSKPLQEFH